MANQFITIITKEKINVKKTGERPRENFFKEIFQWMDFTSYQPFEKIATDNGNGYKVYPMKADDDNGRKMFEQKQTGQANFLA